MTDRAAEEWVAKAEGDFAAAEILMSSGRREVADAIGFHAQQCAEKYLKAMLVHLGKVPPPLHDLKVLLSLAKSEVSRLAGLEEDCEQLTPFAVEFRYPGDLAAIEEVASAVAAAGRVRGAIREALRKR
jgi:HEPN domain-containing protein